ncbi:putative tartrate carrier protein [Escherichia coli]|nr:putative tartrate carrier protein [Escherichia coli]
MVMVALIVVFYLLRYFFASATAYTSALAPMMIAAALAMPEIPLPVFCLMVGAAIGLGSILTPYAHRPPVRFTTAVVYLPTADYWRLGGDFWADIPRIAGDYRLTVDARGVCFK